MSDLIPGLAERFAKLEADLAEARDKYRRLREVAGFMYSDIEGEWNHDHELTTAYREALDEFDRETEEESDD